jgi:ABC-2 type transport system ATP-binding protein
VAEPVVVTERLTKRYGRNRGIEGISLRILRGEVFGLLGPNGAGKTTLIRTLLNLLHPTGGSARIFGLDSRRDSRAIRARIGNLPGDFVADRRMTGRELLRYLAALRGMDGLGRAEELAARLRADLDRPIGALSRGNRQKIGIIQALFHAPELLLLDEPTSGLDPLMQEEFLRLVREERAAGRTVLLSSHELDEVQRVCDRVGLIRSGRLVTVEPVEGLLDNAPRRVSVRVDGRIEEAELAALPGVSDLRVNGEAATFRVSGELDPVVKALAARRVVDLEVARPTLEEVFVAYYEAPEGTA